MTSDDELSINLKSIEINNTTIRYPSHSTRSSTAINNAIFSRNRIEPPLKSYEFMQTQTTPASTVISAISKVLSCSQKVYDMRIKSI